MGFHGSDWMRPTFESPVLMESSCIRTSDFVHWPCDRRFTFCEIKQRHMQNNNKRSHNDYCLVAWAWKLITMRDIKKLKKTNKQTNKQTTPFCFVLFYFNFVVVVKMKWCSGYYGRFKKCSVSIRTLIMPLKKKKCRCSMTLWDPTVPRYIIESLPCRESK